jgi:hypothetical protein
MRVPVKGNLSRLSNDTSLIAVILFDEAAMDNRLLQCESTSPESTLMFPHWFDCPWLYSNLPLSEYQKCQGWD